MFLPFVVDMAHHVTTTPWILALFHWVSLGSEEIRIGSNDADNVRETSDSLELMIVEIAP